MTAPYTIAVAGKGGTGKTTISALLVRALIGLGKVPVLAVDADPNANFHEALGVEVRENLGGMREDAFTKSIPPGMTRTEYIRYRFYQVLVEDDGFDLIAMGRPEGTGCYCFANDLLKNCMRLLERDYQFIIIDSEAGMEHISRGTIGIPDILLIVSDPGARGLRTASRIIDIALDLGIPRSSMHLVFNRYKSGIAPAGVFEVTPLAVVPYDPAVEAADLAATPVSLLPEGSPAKEAVREMAIKLTGFSDKMEKERIK
ncbi:MAG: AAA family ATPase [Methanoregulaceae archaeon]|jgi:CO dehydrogenase maturation factor|nr:AAA family ATPase [Methanoregulaceae archaeon]